MCFGKLHLLIHVKIHMTHATDLELNTRAFAPPFAHINIHSSWKNKGIGGGGGGGCAHISVQVGSSRL